MYPPRRGLYLDASAFVKVVVREPETEALRRFLGEVLARLRAALRTVDLVAVDDRVLDSAGYLEPRILRTLDAVHLATALALGDDLSALVTYDRSMAAGAALLGLPTAAPR